MRPPALCLHRVQSTTSSDEECGVPRPGRRTSRRIGTMRALRCWLGTAALLTTVVGIATAQAPGPDPSARMVLVELYTSQGCDMCPAAEKMLGALAEKDRRIVPIAFHVDYFNDPWKDVFSDPLYS